MMQMREEARHHLSQVVVLPVRHHRHPLLKTNRRHPDTGVIVGTELMRKIVEVTIEGVVVVVQNGKIGTVEAGAGAHHKNQDIRDLLSTTEGGTTFRFFMNMPVSVNKENRVM